MARRKRGRRKTSLVTLARAGTAALIGLSPAINVAVQRLPTGDFKNFQADMTALYSGMDASGNFQIKSLAAGYGPLAAGLLFYWGSGLLFKRLRFR